MHKKSSLLSGVALGVLLAAAMGSAVQAKTHHKAAHAANDGALAAKVESLTDAVSTLEARLNEETAARQATQAAADAARADAAEARAEAADAKGQLATQIQTIPGAVHDAVAANKPKPSWADNTTVSGTMFANASYINQVPHPSASNNNVLNKNENGFNYDIKRFYISVDHKFNDVFSANVTTDFTYDNATATVAGTSAQTLPVTGCATAPCGTITVPATASQTLVTGDKVSQLYLKKAFLQAKLSDALIFRVGAADMPWVPFVENIYGYRYVENIMIDRTKFGTSSDWGIHVLGSIPVSPDVTVNYAVSGVNGMGYKIPGIGTANRSNSMDFEGRISATVDKKLTVAVGGYAGKLGQAVQGVPTYHTAERFDALAAYVDPLFRAGVEYFWASNDMAKYVNTAGPNVTSQGWSVFGSVNVTKKFSVFGRYDWVQPTESTLSKFNDNYFNVGVSYEPTKIVDLALVYKRDAVANGSFATSNYGALASVGSTAGTYDEVGIWTQVKW